MNPVHHVSWPVVAQETLLHTDFFDVNSSPLDFELGWDELRKCTPNLGMSGASTIKLKDVLHQPAQELCSILATA